MKSSKRQLAGALLLMLTALLCKPAAAQFTHTSHDARSGAMGGVLMPDTTRHVTIGYRQGYLLAGMADRRVEAVLPLLGHGLVAAEYNHHGSSEYHEQQLGMAYLLRVAPWLRVGVAARWWHIGVADTYYESQQWLGADVMVEANPDRSTDVLIKAGTRPWDKVHPWRATLQLAYRPVVPWLAVVAVESDDRLRLRGGVEYAYRERLFLRAGLSSNPLLFTCGLGIREGALGIDLGVEVHSTLGVSPSCTLRLCF